MVPSNQAVRASPIPVTWMTREEDSLLTGQVHINCGDHVNPLTLTLTLLKGKTSRGANKQVMKACPEAEGGLSLFQLAKLRLQGKLPELFIFLHPDDPRRMAVNICGGYSIPPSSD